MGTSLVKVIFRGGTEYVYKTKLSLVVGDLVIVYAREEYKVAKVTAVRGFSEFDIHSASKWIVQKIELEAYEEQMKKEEVIQEIKNRLSQRMKETQEILLYQQLAKSDPSIQALLKELEELDPSQLPGQLSSGKEEKEDDQ